MVRKTTIWDIMLELKKCVTLFLVRVFLDLIHLYHTARKYISTIKVVFIDYDEKGPFILINEECVRLPMSGAQPLKGVLIRDRYFTSVESKKALVVEDDDF
jgi:hypothetical protein